MIRSRIASVLGVFLLSLVVLAPQAYATTADTTAPSAPTGVQATKSGNNVSVSWSPATDNVGVSGYEISINGGAYVAASSPYTHSGAAAGKHNYKVLAYDAAGNRSVPASVDYAYGAPLAGAVGNDLAANVGKQVIDGALGLAPIMVPFILALAAIAWVMRKFGLRKRASLNA